MAAAFPASSFHLPLDYSSSISPSSTFLPSSSSSPSLSPINFDAFPSPHHLIEPCVFSVTNKNSMDSSSVVTDKQQLTTPFTSPLVDNNKKRKSKHTSSPNSAQSKDMREVKGKRQRKLVKGGGGSCEEEEKKGCYIHVRARRGQATDSHSLAERVRRERISERMKLLQSLVPGCDKVTGKALMLDEIINYVQSLQNQVEFLSMKLASVNPMLYDFGMDLESLMVKPDQSLAPVAFEGAGMQECSLLDNNNNNNSSNSFLLQQQSQIPYPLPQGEKQVLWGLDEQTQRQKIIINNNSLFSFPLM